MLALKAPHSRKMELLGQDDNTNQPATNASGHHARMPYPKFGLKCYTDISDIITQADNSQQQISCKALANLFKAY